MIAIEGKRRLRAAPKEDFGSKADVSANVRNGSKAMQEYDQSQYSKLDRFLETIAG